MLRSAASEPEWRNHRVVEAGVGIEIGRTKRPDGIQLLGGRGAYHFYSAVLPFPFGPPRQTNKRVAGWLLSFLASSKQTQRELRVWSKVMLGSVAEPRREPETSC